MSKPLAEAFVIILALLNPATADPIRRCISSPLQPLDFVRLSVWVKRNEITLNKRKLNSSTSINYIS